MSRKKYLVWVLCTVTFFVSLYLFSRSDLKYKLDILRACGNKNYTLKALKPLVGPNEISRFIKKYDKHSEIYSADDENFKNAIYKANLHIHTINSDGVLDVKEVMRQAQDYGEMLPDGEYMYVAITDHNTILGGQELVRVLQESQGVYTKAKVVSGIEIYSDYSHNDKSRPKMDIHVLALGINPFDKNLEKEFHKADLKEKWNWKERDFEKVILMMKKYGPVGIAHPARNTNSMGEYKYLFISEIFDRFKKVGRSRFPLLTEGYYQRYGDLGEDHNEFIDYINTEAEKRGIKRTGSTDAHQVSIFYKAYYKKP